MTEVTIAPSLKLIGHVMHKISDANECTGQLFLNAVKPTSLYYSERKEVTARSGGFAACPRLRHGRPYTWKHENVTHFLLPLLTTQSMIRLTSGAPSREKSMEAEDGAQPTEM